MEQLNIFQTIHMSYFNDYTADYYNHKDQKLKNLTSLARYGIVSLVDGY